MLGQRNKKCYPEIIEGLVSGVCLWKCLWGTLVFGGGADELKTHMPLDTKVNVSEKALSYPRFNMFAERPAWVSYLRHAGNITLKNIEVIYQETDFRLAFVFEDEDHLSLSG